jgi:3-deoxy-D-manno-octulosonate 8-phosphate phosphatase (KDO 8-P phosphatase)
MISARLYLMLTAYLQTVLFLTNEGEILRTMNIRDGYAMAAVSGYNVCIISGGSNEGVRIRLRNLGITDIHLGTPNKVETFKEYTDVYTINPEHVFIWMIFLIIM